MTDLTDENTTATEETIETDESNDDSSTTEDGDTTEDAGTEEDVETFTREYVERLRDESARYRTRAQRTDDLAARLHTALVTASGRLADPEDLTFDDAHLYDEDALTDALDDLLTRKPHLASRRATGDIGQGTTGGADTVDLAGILRTRAG